MARAPFITFEGIEGSGKTTLSQQLVQDLQAWGLAVRWTREPGGSATAEALREILLSAEIDPYTEVFLFLADRSHHVRTLLLPTLEAGAWVVCDRFADSTIAYQGYGRGLDIEQVRAWNRIATQGLQPDLTFLIDLPVPLALRRIAKITRFDKESLAFHERVRAGFLQEAQREPERFHLLEGTQAVETLRQEILEVVQRRWRLT